MRAHRFLLSAGVGLIFCCVSRGGNILDSLPKDSRGMIPKAELEKKGLILVSGTVTAVNLKDSSVAITGKKSFVFGVTKDTQIMHSGDRVTLKDVKIGEKVFVLAKVSFDGSSILAVSLTSGNPKGIPVAKPVPGKRGWVFSPYAPNADPISMAGIPHGAEVICPYTKKIFTAP